MTLRDTPEATTCEPTASLILPQCEAWMDGLPISMDWLHLSIFGIEAFEAYAPGCHREVIECEKMNELLAKEYMVIAPIMVLLLHGLQALAQLSN